MTNYKSRICKNWQQGTCQYGQKCTFAHGACHFSRADSLLALSLFSYSLSSRAVSHLTPTMHLSLWCVSLFACLSLIALALTFPQNLHLTRNMRVCPWCVSLFGCLSLLARLLTSHPIWATLSPSAISLTYSRAYKR